MNEHEDEDQDRSEYTMPNCATEVLIYIFSFLKPKHLLKCRLVCSRWKVIADSLCRSETLWRRSCQIDFADIYKTAYYKRKSDVTWRGLYRSLTLWSKLQNAMETRDEFASASRFTDEIRDFQVLRGGEIGIHTRTGIVYYDIKTLKQSNRGIISGDYLRYVENDDIILILGITLHLYVIRKIIRSPRHTEEILLPSVKNFLLHNDVVYYVTMNNEIHMCNLLDEEIKSILLCQMSDSVMCLGYKNGLNILTYERNINTINGHHEIRFQHTLDDAPNLLHVLNQYNFLENLDWRVYFQWMFILRHDIPRGSIRDIIIVKVYGDIVFVGSNFGVFRIYHSPYLNNEFDLFRTEPVKQYNFTERSDCPVLTLSPIIQIDVIEGEDSHTVLVAMPKKIAVLNFSHDGTNKRFNEAQSVQILNTNDYH